MEFCARVLSWRAAMWSERWSHEGIYVLPISTWLHCSTCLLISPAMQAVSWWDGERHTFWMRTACSTKTSKAMQYFGSEMYENKSGCNFGSSAVVDFPVKVDAIIPGFSKNLPLLKCIWPLYWPNTRGNLNRSVLQKVPFCHKRARVAEGMNARWSVELISADLMASFAPCKGIRILESGKFLLVESIWYPLNLWKSWILGFEMWNTAHGTQNPL